MADKFDFDFSELTSLAADLGQVPATAGRFINSAVQVTSGKIAKAARSKVGRRRHFKQAAAGIDYEIKVFQGFGVSVIQSEIGYDKQKTDAAKLGSLVEFGAPGAANALAPGNELQTSLHEQEEDFEVGLSKALLDAERKAGFQ